MTFPWTFKDFLSSNSSNYPGKSDNMHPDLPSFLGATSSNILIATHLKIIVERHRRIIYEKYPYLQIDIFQWLSLIFKDFSRQNAIFQANIKFNDFSRQDLISMTFPGLYEPWFNLLPYNFVKLLQLTLRYVMVVAIAVSYSDFIIMIGCLRSKYRIGHQQT